MPQLKLGTGLRWDEFKVPAEQRPKTLYRYYVTGRGEFPYDMLRYDAAWPSSSQDAFLISETGMRSVQLLSNRKPTIGRWSSFLWSVGKQKL